MTISCLGALANILSLLVWIPQAKTTWEKRKEVEALSEISLWTQFISAMACLFLSSPHYLYLKKERESQ